MVVVSFVGQFVSCISGGCEVVLKGSLDLLFETSCHKNLSLLSPNHKSACSQW